MASFLAEYHRLREYRESNGRYVRHRTERTIRDAQHVLHAARAAQRQEADMNRDRIEGRWKQLSGSLRERWGRLTADHLSVVAGRHDRLAGRCQEQYGITREQSERQLKEFLRRNRV